MLVLFCAPAAFAQPASLEGTAVNGLNGQPLSGVHISLIGISPTGIRDAYGSLSDGHGHFSVTGVPAGMYILFTEKRGFLYVQKKKSGVPLPSMGLKAGEHDTEFKLEMTPRAVISGRVVDDSGDPVENAQVHAQPVSKESEPIALTFGEDTVPTDDRGAFRISGAPGKFYLIATPGGAHDAPPEIRLDGSTAIVYGQTYYPNAAAEEQAAPVDAKAGAEVTGIEIHLARLNPRTTPHLRISGMVQGTPPGKQHASVWIDHGLKFGDTTIQNDTVAGDDGSFTFHDLEPGVYRIWTAYNDVDRHLQSQPLEFRLEGSDVVNLQLNLAPGGDLSGTVEIAGEQPGAPKQKRTVRIGGSEGETDRDGAFHLSGVMPGKYGVGVEPLPENAYVKALTLDSVTVLGDRLDVSHGIRGSKLQIMIAPGGEITGTVLDKDGQRMLNSVTSVFLVPAEGEFEQSDRSAAHVDESATYSFHGVRPGKYYLMGYDLFFSGLEIEGPENIKKAAAAHGELVEVKEGDRIRRNVTIFEEQGDGKK